MTLPAASSLLMHRALRATSFFGGWSEADLDKVVQISHLVKHARGSAVVKPARSWRELLAVVSGSIEVSRTSSDGSKFVLSILRAGDCAGFARLLPNPSLPHDHIAHEDALVIHVPCEPMLQLLDQQPRLWRSVAFFALEKQREKNVSIQRRALSDFPEQLAFLLIKLADASGAAGARPPSLHLSQAELSAMLGVSRQTVNKALRKLSIRHVVAASYGRLDIVDLPALRELAQRSLH